MRGINWVNLTLISNSALFRVALTFHPRPAPRHRLNGQRSVECDGGGEFIFLPHRPPCTKRNIFTTELFAFSLPK